MIKKGKLYYPDKAFKDKAWINDKSIYKKAEKDPIKFWGDLAKEIDWFKEPKKTFSHYAPYFKWFEGGKLNITYNALDKNLETRKNKAALIWEPEPLKEEPRILTYYELYLEVNKFANALKKLGVKKGDRIGIYLPMIPEVVIAMLACARIGAVHAVVFSAFSSTALNIRLLDTETKILITADGYFRRGKVIDLKKNADKALKRTKVKKVIVVKRADNKVIFKKNRDLWWHELVENEEDECPPEKMNSEDTQFILYTSGCCHKDSLVQLDTGEIKKISSLVDEGGSNLVNVNFKQLNQNVDPIVNKYKYSWPFNLVKIKTALSTIKTTPNHPFFVLQDNGDIVEKEAQNLKKRDSVLQATRFNIKGRKQKLPVFDIHYNKKKCTKFKTNKPTIPTFLSPNFAQFLGYFLGDGNISNGGIAITDKDKKNLLLYKELIEKELKVRAYIKKRQRQRLIINSVFLRKYLERAFPELCINSNERKIPLIVQKSEEKCVSAFIRGFFEAEGTVTGAEIKITSKSKLLIQVLQMLLLRFGIISNYFEENRKTTFDKKKYYKILVYGLRITDRSSLIVFEKDVNFSSKVKKTKLKKLLSMLKNKKVSSMIHQFPINNLVKLLRSTIMLPKKEARSMHLDSYIYTNRRIKRKRLFKVKDYVAQKIKLVQSLDLCTRKKISKSRWNDIKKAARLFKLSYGDLARISGKSYNTVHQYIARKKPLVSEETLNKFYKNILFCASDLKKKKLEILKLLLDKLKKLNNLNDFGFFEVKKISEEKNDIDAVYDLEALKNHNYIANGFVVHNSTGRPKGCLHVCGGYTVQAYFTGKWIFDLHDEDIFWSTADVGWITGHTYTVYSPLLNGATFLMFEGAPNWPKPDRWADIIEKHGVNIFYTAPTAIRMFKKQCDKLSRTKFKTLRLLGTVGEPIDEHSWNWFFRNVGREKCPLVDTWWQTETGGILISSLPGIGPFKPAFTGLAFPGFKFDILDDKGKSVKTNKKGNLVLLPPFAPGLLRMVYKDPKKYKKTYWSDYGDKVYFTSDAAYRDKNGLIRIVGRVDDVIKVAGHRVTTGELENVLSKHEHVAECAIIGIPDKIKGEVPVAFIVPKGKVSESDLEKELILEIREKIGPIALPKRIYLVNDLPKTRSGKIMRRIFKRLFTKEPLGDLSTLANPESVKEIKKIIKE